VTGGTGSPHPRAVLAGERVLRVDWLPGADRLRGRCHCGAESEAEDPLEMWEWLLAHPDHPGAAAPPPPTEPPPPPAHEVSAPAQVRALTAARL
jgi:hypothetical protein